MPGNFLHYSALLTTLMLVAAGMCNPSAALHHFAAGDDILVTLLSLLFHCSADAVTRFAHTGSIQEGGVRNLLALRKDGV